MHGINNKYAVVLLWSPIDKDATFTSHPLSLKNYNQAEIYLMTGVAVVADIHVTLEQGVSMASCATALAFEKYYETGFMLKYDGASSPIPAIPGDTITGAAGGYGIVSEDRNGVLVCYGWCSHNAFVNNEVLTFAGSTAKTALVDGVMYNEDIMVLRELAVGVDTFDILIAHDINKMFCIPVNSAMLNSGMDCVAVTCTDCATESLMAGFAILSEPRFIGNPPETAVYD